MKAHEETSLEPLEPGLEPSGPVRQSLARFESLLEDLRVDSERAQDPHARALYDVAAEVLDGLVHAFRHFCDRDEPAWHGVDVPQPHPM